MEEKLEVITNLVQQLALNVAHNTGNNGESQNHHPQTNKIIEDKTLRIALPKFDGHSQDPEVYFDLEANLERYFNFKDTPLEQQYKLAKIKLTKLATVWLEGVQKQRKREDKERINTWEKIKNHLRRKYVPRNYRKQLCMQ